MSFSDTLRLVPGLSLSLLCCAASYAQTPPAQAAPRPPVTAPTAGYHWRVLALRHAVPGDILALMHWDGPAEPAAPAPFDLLPPAGSPAPSPPALPDGVRRIFALRSNNSLLVEANEKGFATVARLINLLDRAPRRVEFHMALVAVPTTRADFYTPDMPAARLLSLLLAGEARVISIPMETVAEGTTASVSIEVPVIAPVGRFRLTQAGPNGRGPSGRCEFRLTPRINTDGTVTLSLTPAAGTSLTPVQAEPPRTVRAGEMAAYEVTEAAQADGERLFLFLSPVIIADAENIADGGQSVGGQTVIVTP